MMILITAALAAAQPASTAPATPPVDAHAQHQQAAQKGMMMSEKEMADCHKCCEEMMAKMHEGHEKHSDHKPQ